jgi:hypothetical protein
VDWIHATDFIKKTELRVGPAQNWPTTFIAQRPTGQHGGLTPCHSFQISNFKFEMPAGPAAYWQASQSGSVMLQALY